MRAKPHKGAILLIVVVLVMLLSLAAYKFMLSMQTENLAASLDGDRLQAQQAALSSRDLLCVMLELPRASRDQLGGLQDNPRYFGGNTTALSQSAVSGSGFGGSSFTASGTESDFSSADDLATATLQPIGLIAYADATRLDSNSMFDSSSGFGSSRLAQSSRANPSSPNTTDSSGTDAFNGSLSASTDFPNGPPTIYGARNESAKLHLARVMQWEIADPGAGVAALMQLPGMDEATANAMLDWIDADDEPRAGGAESDFYATLTRPLAPRNGVPPDVDELLFVKGVSAYRLFGGEHEMPETGLTGLGTASAPNASSFGAGASSLSTANNGSFGVASDQPVRPWSELLTVYGAERNETYTGESRLFLNESDLSELYEDLKEIMPEDWAKFVILFRQFGEPLAPEPTNDDEFTVSPPPLEPGAKRHGRSRVGYNQL